MLWKPIWIFLVFYFFICINKNKCIFFNAEKAFLTVITLWKPAVAGLGTFNFSFDDFGIASNLLQVEGIYYGYFVVELCIFGLLLEKRFSPEAPERSGPGEAWECVGLFRLQRMLGLPSKMVENDFAGPSAHPNSMTSKWKMRQHSNFDKVQKTECSYPHCLIPLRPARQPSSIRSHHFAAKLDPKSALQN